MTCVRIHVTVRRQKRGLCGKNGAKAHAAADAGVPEDGGRNRKMIRSVEHGIKNNPADGR
jgi:hypothetical protein